MFKGNQWDHYLFTDDLYPDLGAMAVLHYCCYSSPLVLPSPILHHSSLEFPSLCPLTVHSALCPHLAVPPIKSLYLVTLSLLVLSPWPHLSSSPRLFHPLILVSINLPLSPPVTLLSSTSSLTIVLSFFPLPLLSSALLRPVHRWISIHTRNPGDSMDTSTQLTSPPSAADRRRC